MQELINFLFFLIILIPSAIIHEYAHGWMADRLGDPTARYMGRLTLNPKAHVDLWGTILLPLILSIISGGRFIFAYAKPVPYNPYNLRYQRWGPAIVGLAGPLANLLLASAFAVLTRVAMDSNLASFLATIVYANVMLLVFNLVPIPPLDGSKILYAILPDSAQNIKIFLEKYGTFILLFFIFFLFDIISPIINLIYNLLVGI